MRHAVLLLVLSGCSRVASMSPKTTPLDAGRARCAPGATATPDSSACLVLPAGYQLVRKERDPAFDRLAYGYNRAGDRPAEIRLDLQWFPFGRDAAAEERDYAAEVAHLFPDVGDLEFDSSTDAAGGRFVRVRLRPDGGGEENDARALIETPHYRVRCSVDLPGLPDIPVLDACRTLAAAE